MHGHRLVIGRAVVFQESPIGPCVVDIVVTRRLSRVPNPQFLGSHRARNQPRAGGWATRRGSRRTCGLWGHREGCTIPRIGALPRGVVGWVRAPAIGPHGQIGSSLDPHLLVREAVRSRRSLSPGRSHRHQAPGTGFRVARARPIWLDAPCCSLRLRKRRRGERIHPGSGRPAKGGWLQPLRSPWPCCRPRGSDRVGLIQLPPALEGRPRTDHRRLH